MDRLHERPIRSLGPNDSEPSLAVRAGQTGPLRRGAGERLRREVPDAGGAIRRGLQGLRAKVAAHPACACRPRAPEEKSGEYAEGLVEGAADAYVRTGRAFGLITDEEVRDLNPPRFLEQV